MLKRRGLINLHLATPLVGAVVFRNFKERIRNGESRASLSAFRVNPVYKAALANVIGSK